MPGRDIAALNREGGCGKTLRMETGPCAMPTPEGETNVGCGENFCDPLASNIWPPNSLDCDPLDYHVWDTVELEINKTSYNTKDELKARITTAFTNLNKEMVNKIPCVCVRVRQ